MTRFNLLSSSRNAAEIETRIERLGIVPGIDWGNLLQVRALAREAPTKGCIRTGVMPENHSPEH